jgi:hypothetical protein
VHVGVDDIICVGRTNPETPAVPHRAGSDVLECDIARISEIEADACIVLRNGARNVCGEGKILEREEPCPVSMGVIHCVSVIADPEHALRCRGWGELRSVLPLIGVVPSGLVRREVVSMKMLPPGRMISLRPSALARLNKP